MPSELLRKTALKSIRIIANSAPVGYPRAIIAKLGLEGLWVRSVALKTC